MGYNYLSNKNKKKYARIKMNENSKQWETKTISQKIAKKEYLRNRN